jgi:hypothetical protein
MLALFRYSFFDVDFEFENKSFSNVVISRQETHPGDFFISGA